MFRVHLLGSFDALGTLLSQVNTPMFRTDEAKVGNTDKRWI